MNRLLNIAHPWATLCLMLTLIASCSEKTIDPSDQLPPTDTTPIAFSTEDAFTKAVISDAADLQADPNGFRVWGWFEGITSGHMFYEDDQKRNDGTTVTYTNSTWTYSPARYWMNGTYDFAAVYPAAVTTVEGETTTTTDISGSYAPASGTTVLTVPNFDVTTQADLCVAFNNGTDGTGINGATPPATVDLNFQHTLSLVQIELKLDKADFFECQTDDDGNLVLDSNNEPIILLNEDGTKKQLGYAYVASAGFSNMSKVATLTGSAPDNMNWSLSSEKGDIVLEYDQGIEVGVDYTNILSTGNLLLLPQNFDANNPAKLYAELGILFPGISERLITKELVIDLNALDTKTWAPNKKYRYIGTISQDFVIDFNIVKIEDWEDNTLGGLIVY